MQRSLTLGLILLITTGLIFGLVSYIGFEGFLFAWMLNIVLMMCVFQFTEALKSKFTSGYFAQQDWEHKGRIYEKLGVNVFRKLLVLIGWEKLNKKANPVKNDLKALSHLEYRTKQSELGHIIIFVIVLGFTVFIALRFGVAASMWLILLNVLLNVYPIFLQRYNRPRLQRTITLLKHKKGMAKL